MEFTDLAGSIVQGQNFGIAVLEAIISNLNDTKIIILSNKVPYGYCLLISEHITIAPLNWIPANKIN